MRASSLSDSTAAACWQVAAKPAARLTYALVTQDVEFAGARNCGKMTKLDALLSASALAPDTVRAEIAAAFAMWQAAANIGFREAADPAKADILIGAQLEPEGWAFANVFYDTASTEPVKPISRALVCLNPQKRWKVGFDGDLRSYDMRYTIAHEIGHTIGLDHPGGARQIMGYRYGDVPLAPGETSPAPASTASRSRTASWRRQSRMIGRGTLPPSASTPSAGEPGPSPRALRELCLHGSRRTSWDAERSASWCHPGACLPPDLFRGSPGSISPRTPAFAVARYLRQAPA
jgi:hypothetical protein